MPGVRSRIPFCGFVSNQSINACAENLRLRSRYRRPVFDQKVSVSGLAIDDLGIFTGGRNAVKRWEASFQVAVPGGPQQHPCCRQDCEAGLAGSPAPGRHAPAEPTLPRRLCGHAMTLVALGRVTWSSAASARTHPVRARRWLLLRSPSRQSAEITGTKLPDLPKLRLTIVAGQTNPPRLGPSTARITGMSPVIYRTDGMTVLL